MRQAENECGGIRIRLVFAPDRLKWVAGLPTLTATVHAQFQCSKWTYRMAVKRKEDRKAGERVAASNNEQWTLPPKCHVSEAFDRQRHERKAKSQIGQTGNPQSFACSGRQPCLSDRLLLGWKKVCVSCDDDAAADVNWHYQGNWNPKRKKRMMTLQWKDYVPKVSVRSWRSQLKSGIKLMIWH